MAPTIARTTAAAAAQDDAVAIVGEQKHAIDPEVASRVVHKIDCFLIPAMVIGCT